MAWPQPCSRFAESGANDCVHRRIRLQWLSVIVCLALALPTIAHERPVGHELHGRTLKFGWGSTHDEGDAELSSFGDDNQPKGRRHAVVEKDDDDQPAQRQRTRQSSLEQDEDMQDEMDRPLIRKRKDNAEQQRRGGRNRNKFIDGNEGSKHGKGNLIDELLSEVSTVDIWKPNNTTKPKDEEHAIYEKPKALAKDDDDADDHIDTNHWLADQGEPDKEDEQPQRPEVTDESDKEDEQPQRPEVTDEPENHGNSNGAASERREGHEDDEVKFETRRKQQRVANHDDDDMQPYEERPSKRRGADRGDERPKQRAGREPVRREVEEDEVPKNTRKERDMDERNSKDFTYVIESEAEEPKKLARRNVDDKPAQEQQQKHSSMDDFESLVLPKRGRPQSVRDHEDADDHPLLHEGRENEPSGDEDDRPSERSKPDEEEDLSLTKQKKQKVKASRQDNADADEDRPSQRSKPDEEEDLSLIKQKKQKVKASRQDNADADEDKPSRDHIIRHKEAAQGSLIEQLLDGPDSATEKSIEQDEPLTRNRGRREWRKKTPVEDVDDGSVTEPSWKEALDRRRKRVDDGTGLNKNRLTDDDGDVVNKPAAKRALDDLLDEEPKKQGLQLNKPAQKRPPRKGNQQWPDGIPDTNRYLDVLTCKGFPTQAAALLDAVALAYLLNATLLLPHFYSHYDYLATSQESRIPQWNNVANHDPQSEYAVPMKFFFDVNHFKEGLLGKLNVVDELPKWLQGDTTFSRLPVRIVDPERPSTLLPYQRYLNTHSVLRLKCTSRSVKWITQELGALRATMLKRLRPSQQFVSLLEQALVSIQQVIGKDTRFVGLHLRNEEEWLEYCTTESKMNPDSYIDNVDECYMNAEDVARVLEQRSITKQFKAIYIASTSVSKKTADKFSIGRVTVLHKGNTWAKKGTVPQDFLSHRELSAALDFWVMRLADLFVGNLFSTMSWLVRECDFVARKALRAPTRAIYYNAPLLYTKGDINLMESLRWRVYPGVLHPDWPVAQHMKDDDDVDESDCTTTACQAELLRRQTERSGMGGHGPQQCKLRRTQWLDTGHVLVEGECGSVVQEAKVLIDDQERKTIFVNVPIDDKGTMGFVSEVAVPLGRKEIKVDVCVMKDREVCSTGGQITTNMRLERIPPSADTVPTVFMHFPHKAYTSGGPEALHQLHQMINKLYSEGKINVRSKFPDGNAMYKGEYSDFDGEVPFNPGELTALDYVIVPEHMGVDDTWSTAADEIGFLPLVWYVGQHVDRYKNDMADKQGFKPVCLTEYYALQHDCGLKAVLNTPMADSFYQESAKYRKQDPQYTAKKDIILFDGDELGNLDVSKIKVPKGAKLVELHGVERGKVIQVFKQSKLYIDSYITGMERAIFEGILFGVIPLIANHGQGRDEHNYMIKPQWKWEPWDYDDLNAKIDLALNNYDNLVEDFQPMLQYTLAMPARFEQQVARFFSDDVHIIVSAQPFKGGNRLVSESYATVVSLFTAINYPFATVEVITDNEFYFGYDNGGPLQALDNAGYYKSFAASSLLAEFKSFGKYSHYLQPPDHLHKRQYVLLLPSGVVPLDPHYAANLLHVARQGSYTVVFAPNNVMLVHWDSYYTMTREYLGVLGERGLSIGALKKLMDALSLQYKEIKGDTVAAPSSRGCTQETLFLNDQPHSSCFCGHLRRITSHPIWNTAVPKFVPNDVLKWLDKIYEKC